MKEARIQNVSPKVYNGIHYRSTLEADTASVLDRLGIPFQYEKRKIILQKGFRCPYQKDKVRDLTYTPDFIIGPVILECKGFETPEWKIKKKLIFRWLTDNEPETLFYQIHDSRKALMEALDPHLSYLGYCVQVIPKPSKKTVQHGSAILFDSVTQAVEELHLKGKNTGPILRSLTGEKDYVYNYNWKLVKIKL